MNRKRTSLQKNEDGIGYVESLIAITVAGVACVALLSVAVMVMREAKNNEYRDVMNQYALEGFEVVRSISVSDYSQITAVCESANKVGFLVESNPDPQFPHVDALEVPEDDHAEELCSDLDFGENGNCEKLPMPGYDNVGDTFYREVHVEEDLVLGCDRVKVIVKVGLFPVSEGDPGRNAVRNFKTDIEIVGYVVN